MTSKTDESHGSNSKAARMASESTSKCRQKVRKSGGAQKNKRKFQGKGFASNTTKILGGTGSPDSLSSVGPASISQCPQKVRKSGGAQKNKRTFQEKGFASDSAKIFVGTGTPDSLSFVGPASSKTIRMTSESSTSQSRRKVRKSKGTKRNRRPGTTSKVFEGKCPPGPSNFASPATSSTSVKSSTSLFDKSDFKTLVKTMQALHKRKHLESER